MDSGAPAKHWRFYIECIIAFISRYPLISRGGNTEKRLARLPCSRAGFVKAVIDRAGTRISCLFILVFLNPAVPIVAAILRRGTGGSAYTQRKREREFLIYIYYIIHTYTAKLYVKIHFSISRARVQRRLSGIEE